MSFFHFLSYFCQKLDEMFPNFNCLSSRRYSFIFLLLVCCLATLPFLGLTDFNTKGEPREAVVAFSILEQNNWILPTNNGGEIPYKPPFFHWTIAAASLLNGGVVNEYTSRLPSAVALIAMTLAIFSFFARRGSVSRALLTAMLSFTAFEIYRAGMNCRVDMMLTALSVMAILALYRWWEAGMKSFPWLAILLMSAATLTKGPVGIIIPCLSVGIFMLLRGVPFFKAFIWLSLWAVLSLVLPLSWYVAAYHQGGKEFLDLVLEENFGRMTGTMAYESHLNPWYYNLLTLFTGFLPWTIAALTALFVIPRKSYARLSHVSLKSWQEIRNRIRSASPVTLLALTCALTIFIFYCIPASKRSVYLMPMYPFTAFFLAQMIEWMARRRSGSIRGLGNAFAIIGIVLFILFCMIQCGLIPDSIFGHGKHAPQNVAMLHALRDNDGFRPWFWATTPLLAAFAWRFWLSKTDRKADLPLNTSLMMVSLYLAFSGCYQPAVLTSKSMKPMAVEIMAHYPDSSEKIYEFIAMAEEAAGNPIHYFELDFYMGDPIRNFRRERPDEGYLLIGTGDTEQWFPRFEEEGYTFTLLRTPQPSQPRHTPALYRFTRTR